MGTEHGGPAGQAAAQTLLAALYGRALPQVYGYLLPRCGSAMLAEDLTAETFVAAVAAARRDHPPELTVGWLIGVARHKLVDHWRRADREQRGIGLLASTAEPAEDPWDEHLDVAVAHAALARLPAQQRAALTLRYLDGLPVADVARELGRTLHAPETLLVRARAPSGVSTGKRRLTMTPDALDALRLPPIPVEPRPDFTASLWRRLQGEQDPATGGGATIRYFVPDLAVAVDFYCRELGFDEELRPAPTFAMLYRGDLRLLLSVPGRAHALPDGRLPDSGGWNRIVLEVADLTATVGGLEARGVSIRHGIVTSVGVRQALIEDPAGNPVELFEPLAGYHERARRAGSD